MVENGSKTTKNGPKVSFRGDVTIFLVTDFSKHSKVLVLMVFQYKNLSFLKYLGKVELF